MLFRHSLTAASIFGCGFALAWLAKPSPKIAESTLSPLWTREERPDRPLNTAKATATSPSAAALQRLLEAGYDAEKRDAVIASLNPEEIPELLAELRGQASVYELSHEETEQFEAIVQAWYAKAPTAALTWLHALPKSDDRERLLGIIVDGLAATDLDAALALLRQHGSNEAGGVTIPEVLLENAPMHGADTLVAFCRLELNRGGSYIGYPANYPDDFDFKRALDGLVTARDALGEGMDYHTLPSNLMSEWTLRNPEAAWTWLQQGQTIMLNGTEQFFKAFVSTEAGSAKDVGVMLASTFEPTAEPDMCYANVWAALGTRSSPELLDSFLQAVSGVRATHLDGLFDHAWSWLGGKPEQMHVCAMLLERMTPAQRLETMRCNSPYLLSEEARSAYTPVLRRLGHSDEEIHTLWPQLTPSEQ